MNIRLLALAMVGAACTLVLATPPAVAQQELKVRKGKPYKHPHSKVSVPATLGGIARDKATAYHDDALDVGLAFDAADGSEALTIYIYRNTNGAVPVWFEQAVWAIENRDIYGTVTPAIPVRAFAPPNQTVEAGLMAVYASAGGPFQSTGVALLPVGEWYVKLRASSKTKSPQQLYDWLNAALAEVEWPRSPVAAPIAVPVTSCTTELALDGVAKPAKVDKSDALIGALLGMAITDASKKPGGTPAPAPAAWCRDGAVLEGNMAAYRADESTTSYLVAAGDNGIGVSVASDSGSALMAVLAKEEDGDIATDDDGTTITVPPSSNYRITLHVAHQQATYPPLDRLPAPAQAARIASEQKPQSVTNTWGKDRTVQIGADAL